MTKCAFIDYLVRRLRQLSKGMYKKATYVRVYKFMIQKENSLFIPVKFHSITISSVIPYISEINSTSSSLKKKGGGGGGMERGCAKEREKKRGKRKKERESVKGKRKKMGRRRKRRKRRRENEKEREGEERIERERRG